MTIEPSEFSDEELETYLRDIFNQTEELNANAIRIHVHDGIVHLTGSVPTAAQREVVEMLVLDVVPEDKLADDLYIDPEVGTEESPPVPDEPQPDVELAETDVEEDNAEEAAQQGRTYEPPVAPKPESQHEGDW